MNDLEQVRVSEVIIQKELEMHRFPMLGLRARLHVLGDKIQKQVKDCQQNGRQILHIGLGLAPIQIAYDGDRAEPVFDDDHAELFAIIMRTGPSGMVPDGFYDAPKFPDGWQEVATTQGDPPKEPEQ